MTTGLVIKDAVTPDLKRKAASIRNSAPILRAGAQEIVNITVEAFTNPALRIASWPKKRDGRPSVLFKTGALKHSIRVGDVTNSAASVASDRPYAAGHQLGTKKLPRRPFFPFDPEGNLAPFARARVNNVMQAKADKLLGLK
ncbi:MAG: hypothetical protein PHI35_00675 [Victivallaceae bacterium]|nr:hypothetical protein [Victivallaceae bacterium]